MFQVDLDFNVNVTYAVPPVAVVQVSDVYHHKFGIALYLPVLYAIAGCFFLLVSLWFLCCYCLKIEQVRLRFYGVVGRVEVGEILINREQPVQPEEDQLVDHPIWYIRTQGLQQSVIDSISIVKFKKNEGLVEGSDCSICLSDFDEDESLRLLPKCEHAFHVPCIDQWFKSHKNCPLCRAPVANVTMVDVPAEENDVGLEGQQSDETVIAVVNTSSQEDSDSSMSENGRYALATNKDSSFSGSSESKSDEYEVPQLMRRSLSAGPVTSSNISETVADVKIRIDSDASAESGSSLVQRMKRSMSYGGKPSSVKSSRNQKSILPY